MALALPGTEIQKQVGLIGDTGLATSARQIGCVVNRSAKEISLKLQISKRNHYIILAALKPSNKRLSIASRTKQNSSATSKSSKVEFFLISNPLYTAR